MCGEVEDVAFVEGGFVAFNATPQRPTMPPAAMRPEAKRSRGDFAVDVGCVAAGFFHGLIDEPADHASAEDGQRGANRQIGADGERERADS